MNSGLEKIPEFISEKGDFGDSSSEMECYAGMEKLAQDIERDEDWEPEMFEENEDDELSDDV